MRVEMLMPQMGESITEATISKWLKGPGDRVEKDETILEISTDKVDSEIPSPASGILADVIYKEGDVVPVKTKIAVIDTDGASAAVTAAPPPAAQKVEQAQTPAASAGAAPVRPEKPLADDPTAERFYSPLVMSLAQKHGLGLSELEKIPGSGQGGRVTKQDLLAYVEALGKPASGAAVPAAQPATKPSPARETKPPRSDIPWGPDGTKTITMDTMRQVIAEHMVRSKQTSPHVYSIQEVDLTRVSRWRQKNRREFEAREGFKLSFTPFFLDAAVKALLKYPYVNSSVEGKNIVLKRHINLGCAVAIGDPEKGSGLIVPVIKHAEEKNLVGLARSLNDLATRARIKKLVPEEVAGGTFTVTNPGVFGTMIGTPIINQPQVAILCLGAITKRPVVIDDMIAIREMCFLTLSYDHRIVDGALGGVFLAEIRACLENWDEEQPLL